MMEAVCKGCWELNTACRQCSRCRETAPEAAGRFADELNVLRQARRAEHGAVVKLMRVRELANRDIGMMAPPRHADLMALAMLADDLAHELDSDNLGAIAVALSAASVWRERSRAASPSSSPPSAG